jgi:hypothetical protein
VFRSNTILLQELENPLALFASKVASVLGAATAPTAMTAAEKMKEYIGAEVFKYRAIAISMHLLGWESWFELDACVHRHSSRFNQGYSPCQRERTSVITHATAWARECSHDLKYDSC